MIKRCVISLAASYYLLTTVVFSAYAPEIGQLNLGAKPVGLGNAMTAMSGDVNALYYNPAGLVSVRNIQGHLFATQSLNEINQMTVGGTLPLEFGTFGIGWTNYGVDGISLGANPAALTTGSFGQSVTYFSLAVPFGDWSWGATLKYFSAAGTGAGLSNAGASGYDLDLGMQTMLTSDLRFGLLLKNLLPSSPGNSMGSLVYQTGTTEGFLGSLHAGLAYEFYKKQLIFSGEVIGYEANQYPIGYALGADFKFTKTLTLRGSYSTVPVPAGVGMRTANDQAGSFGMGVGYRMGDFSLDYAYNTGYDFLNNAQHFISLSYLGAEDQPTQSAQPTPNEKPVDQFVLESPKDYQIVLGSQILVTGYARGFSEIRINEKSFPVIDGQKFSVPVTLALGRSTLRLGIGSETFTRNVLRLGGYEVLLQNGLDRNLEYVMTLSPSERGRFYGRAINKSELAQMIIALKEIQIPANMAGVFSPMDVLFVKGYFTADSTSPLAGMTRGEMAVVLARLEGAKENVDDSLPATQRQAAAIRFLAGLKRFSENDFFPIQQEMTVAETYAYLAKTSTGQSKMSMLLKGFAYPIISDQDLKMAAGSTQTLFVQFPEENQVSELSGQFLEQGVLFQKLNERFFTGVINVGTAVAVGEQTLVLKVKDLYGNQFDFPIAMNVDNKFSGTPGMTAYVSPLPIADNPVFVKIWPRPVALGEDLSFTVGVPASLRATQVQVIVDQIISLVLVPGQAGIWEGKIQIPTNFQKGTHGAQVLVTTVDGQISRQNLTFVVGDGGYVVQTTTKPVTREPVASDYVYPQGTGAVVQADDLTATPSTMTGITPALPLIQQPVYDKLSNGEPYVLKISPSQVPQGTRVKVSAGFPEGGFVKQVRVAFNTQKQFSMKKVSDILWTSEFFIGPDFPTGRYRMKMTIEEESGKLHERDVYYEIIAPKPVSKITANEPTKNVNVKDKPKQKEFGPVQKTKPTKTEKPGTAPTVKPTTPVTKAVVPATKPSAYDPSLVNDYNPIVKISDKATERGDSVFLKISAQKLLGRVWVEYLGKENIVAYSGGIYQGKVIIPLTAKTGRNSLRVYFQTPEGKYFFIEQQIIIK